jgi:ABC-2 type transport system permease protein
MSPKKDRERIFQKGGKEMKWIRIKAIIWKEFIQIRRDRPSLAIALAMPIMMMLAFGYA